MVRAQQKIDHFTARFRKMGYGDGHLIFALHAAFPLGLTPHLLYQLWANFNTFPEGNTLRRIALEAVSDLLLSNLCRETGDDLFEMDPDVRRELLRQLEADPRFGTQRLEQLAFFLYQYVQVNLVENENQALRDAQEWMALSVLAPEKAATEIVKALTTNIDQKNKGEVLRLSNLLAQFSTMDAGFENLQQYTQGLRAGIFGNQEAAGSFFQKVLTLTSAEDAPEGITTLTIPLMQEVKKNQLQFRKAKTAAELEVERRIEALQSGEETILNLSDIPHLGVIPEIVSRLTALKGLIADGSGIKGLPDFLFSMQQLEGLGFARNALAELPAAIGRLSALRNLNLDHNALSTLPESLFRLPALETLSLQHNHLEMIPPAILELPPKTDFRAEGNPAFNVPPEAPLNDLYELQQYFRSLETEAFYRSEQPNFLLLDLNGSRESELQAAEAAYRPFREEARISDVVLRDQPAGTVYRFLRSPNEYIILHLTGSELTLPTRKGERERPTPAGLADWLRPALSKNRLVILTFPETRDYAQALVDAGCPAVVFASAFTGQQDVLEFTKQFYRYLGEGDTIRQAFDRATSTPSGDIPVQQQSNIPSYAPTFNPWELLLRNDRVAEAGLDWRYPTLEADIAFEEETTPENGYLEVLWPDRFEVGKYTQMRVRISTDRKQLTPPPKAEGLLRQLRNTILEPDDQVTRIPLTAVVEVSLHTDPSVQTREVNEQEQWIDPEGQVTEWSFYLNPTQAGTWAVEVRLKGAVVSESTESSMELAVHRHAITAVAPAEQPALTEHLLLIAVDQYEHLPRLNNCIRDAERLAQALSEEYGFLPTHTMQLFDRSATRNRILRTLDDLTVRLGPEDQLLLVFFGHADHDPELRETFWIPVDGEPSDRSRWIPFSTIARYLRNIPAANVLVVADTTYGGNILQLQNPPASMVAGAARSRWLLASTSSGEQPADGRDGQSNPFVEAILQILRDNISPDLDVEALGQLLLQSWRSMDDLPHTPAFGPLWSAGHQEGQFTFHLRKPKLSQEPDDFLRWKADIQDAIKKGDLDNALQWTNDGVARTADVAAELLDLEAQFHRLTKMETEPSLSPETVQQWRTRIQNDLWNRVEALEPDLYSRDAEIRKEVNALTVQLSALLAKHAQAADPESKEALSQELEAVQQQLRNARSQPGAATGGFVLDTLRRDDIRKCFEYCKTGINDLDTYNFLILEEFRYSVLERNLEAQKITPEHFLDLLWSWRSRLTGFLLEASLTPDTIENPVTPHRQKEAIARADVPPAVEYVMEIMPTDHPQYGETRDFILELDGALQIISLTGAPETIDDLDRVEVLVKRLITTIDLLEGKAPSDSGRIFKALEKLAINIGSLSPEAYLTCNRQPSMDFLLARFEKLERPPASVWIIPARERERPESLITRFLLELDRQTEEADIYWQRADNQPVIQTIPFSPARNLRQSQNQLNTVALEQWQALSGQEATGEVNPEVWLSLPYRQLAFVLTMEQRALDMKLLPEILGRSLEQLTEKLPPEGPSIMLFLIIEREADDLPKKRDDWPRIEKELRNLESYFLPNVTVLSELPSVHRSDIREWFFRHGEANLEVIEEILSAFAETLPEAERERFAREDLLPMNRVETILKYIVDGLQGRAQAF